MLPISGLRAPRRPDVLRKLTKERPGDRSATAPLGRPVAPRRRSHAGIEKLSHGFAELPHCNFTNRSQVTPLREGYSAVCVEMQGDDS